MEVRFTPFERTTKKHTLEFATEQALAVLRDKYRLENICVDVIKKFDKTALLTTCEVSQIVENLIDDTLYWAGAFHGTMRKA